jgi:hypothetical protein
MNDNKSEMHHGKLPAENAGKVIIGNDLRVTRLRFGAMRLTESVRELAHLGDIKNSIVAPIEFIVRRFTAAKTWQTQKRLLVAPEVSSAIAASHFANSLSMRSGSVELNMETTPLCCRASKASLLF